MKQIDLLNPKDLFRAQYNNHVTRNATGQLTGVNLCGEGLDDEQINKKLSEDLSQLQVLNLSENRMESFTVPTDCEQLEYLDISENPGLKTVSLANGSNALKVLNASECAIAKLILPEEFDSLQTVDLRKNALSHVEIKGNCPSLISLDLSENQLEELILSSGFQNLQYLYLNDNQLSKLKFQSALTRLKTLHIRNNQLKALPDNLLLMEELETLYLYGNRVLDIPQEVIANGERDNSRDSVWNHLKSIQDGKARYLHQAKMILVGNGEVGKTSLRTKLINKKAPLPTKKDRTPGLDVIPCVIEKLERKITNLEEEIDFQLRIWDFGGQGKYREVQQLFCSRKSLYIFVTSHDDSPRKQNYVGFEYWLSMVNAYSYDQSDDQYSPVIHVVNKIDEKHVPINQEDLMTLFPNIHPQFIQISCKTLKNFSNLEQTIREVLPKVSPDVFSNKYGESRMKVKELLEAKEESHISYETYEDICAKHQMDKTDARTWIETLGRIGNVIYFGNHSELNDWVILNPSWVKDAMYNVLDADLVESGKLESSHFKYIWPENTAEEHNKFIALILAYKLGYEQQDSFGKISYVIPALLPAEKPSFPSYLQSPTYQIKFVFDPFIPAGTVNKLIVSIQQKESLTEIPASRSEDGKFKDLYTSIHSNLIWKNNVVIHDPHRSVYGHLEEVWEDKAVYLNLFGDNVKPLFQYLTTVLRQINQNLKDTKYLHYLSLESMGWHKEKWRPLLDLADLQIDFFQDIISPVNPMNVMERIKELIRQGRLEAALVELETFPPSHLKNTAIALQQRWNTLKTQNISGVISTSEMILEQNRITQSTLEFVNRWRGQP